MSKSVPCLNCLRGFPPGAECLGFCDGEMYLVSPRLHARVLSGHTSGVSFHYRPCDTGFDRFFFCLACDDACSHRSECVQTQSSSA